jgi:cell division protein FtsB
VSVPTDKTVAWRGRAARFLVLVLILALGYSLFAGQYGFLEIINAKSRIAALDDQEQELTVKLVDLELMINRLETDSLLLEKRARRLYRLARPDEIIIEF